MFLSNTILKRLMKQAYKDAHLVVAQTEERYYISGIYWEMDVKKEFMPKQIMAQLIELAGEVPGIGKAFRATKDGNLEEDGLRTEVRIYGSEKPIDVTDIIVIGSLGTYQRVLQEQKSGKTYIVNNVFIDIADNKATDEDRGEFEVTVPMYHEQYGILWVNNVARLRAGWRFDDKHRSMIQELSGIDLTRVDEL